MFGHTPAITDYFTLHGWAKVGGIGRWNEKSSSDKYVIISDIYSYSEEIGSIPAEGTIRLQSIETLK